MLDLNQRPPPCKFHNPTCRSVLACPEIWLFCSSFTYVEHLLGPPRTNLYQPGCSTVAVNPLEQIRMADLLITSLLEHVLARPTASGICAYSGGFRRPSGIALSGLYRLVSARLR
jgi:hypothetical protein